MPYIGNPIYQSAFVTDQFSGNGSTTAFTMSVSPAGTTNVLVAVSGVLQDPSTYGVSGNTLTFSTAPPSGTGNISVRYLGVPVTGIVTTAYRTVTEFTATASQTTFTPPSYTVGFINVYLNGVLLGSADYTATNGTTVVLATGASAGNLVTVESFRVETVLNAISNSAGSVGTTNIADNAITTAKILDSAVTTAKIADNSITTAKIAAGAVVAADLATGAVNLASSTVTGVLPRASLPTGSVLQVVRTTITTQASYSLNNAAIQATALTASITPTSSSSHIIVQMMASINSDSAGQGLYGEIRRGTSTTLNPTAGGGTYNYPIHWLNTNSLPNIGSGGNQMTSQTWLAFDSPATTSATSYTFYAYGVPGTTNMLLNSFNSGRASSVIVLWEIAG